MTAFSTPDSPLAAWERELLASAPSAQTPALTPICTRTGPRGTARSAGSSAPPVLQALHAAAHPDGAVYAENCREAPDAEAWSA